MKRIAYVTIALLALSACLAVSRCARASSARSTIAELLDVSTPASLIIHRHEDTHGGFHGDGDLVLIAEVPPSEQVKWLQDLQTSGVWGPSAPEFSTLASKPSPFPMDTTGFLFAGLLKLPGTDGAMQRQTAPVLGQNFTAAAYDPATGMLYIYDLDM